MTIKLIEDALCVSINSYAGQSVAKALTLDASDAEVKADYVHVNLDQVGYIQYIDYEHLNETAQEANINIYLTASAGDFVNSVDAFVFVSKTVDSEVVKKIEKSIVIDKERTFSQDPRYGFMLLSEVALRALSPGINDPGTAIDVIHTQVRVFKLWNEFICDDSVQDTKSNPNKASKDEESLPLRVFARKIRNKDILEGMYLSLIESAFTHILVSRELRRSIVSVLALCPEADRPSCEYWLRYLDKMCETSFDEEQLALVRID